MKKSKVALIGPVYPYKGGISHYTGLMYRVLKKKYDVFLISYQFQYPKLLYKKEQKDYSNDNFKIKETNYWIHTLNPFNWFKVIKKIRALDPDLIIFQWWHPYFAPCYWVLCKYLKNKKLLFVCHNVFPHERFPLDKLLTKAVLKQGDSYIVQSKTDAEDLQRIINNPVFEQTVHPSYNTFKFENMTKKTAREKLQLEEKHKVLLFFGFIREYKGLKYLIQAMEETANQLENLKLLIVGDFSNATEKKEYKNLILQCGAEGVITIYDGYIPDKEVEKFFAASDLVVLPYVSATQSGIVQIAFSFDKPVVVTDVGGLPDVVKNNFTGYVVESQKPDQLSNAIVKFFKEEKSNQFVENIKKEADRFSWDKMLEVIDKLK